ncbi:MAG: TlpA family protein disulfide reductase [Synergistaceae bacterium]|jgi:thiol-disulfide isomerase/thioredoxin|nr:TlpA family protein disulfide reductase [Synergistaceae bacterium]
MFFRLVSKFLILAVTVTAVMAFAQTDALAANVFPAFKSITLDGKSVTEAIFAGKKLTMLNIWATWCPPCVAEMPDLGSMGRAMPDGTQLVGLVFDISAGDRSAKSKAEEILSGAKANFVQIEYSDDMYPYLETVDAIPTTIFVDAKGNIIGEPLVGSRSEKDYRAAIEKILKSL